MTQILNLLLSSLAGSRTSGAAETLVKAELGLTYVKVIKDLKIFCLVIFGLSMISSSAFFGLFVFIYSLMRYSQSSENLIFLTMGLLGSINLILGFAVFFILSSDKFWLKIFKISDVVKNIENHAPK